MICFYWFGNLPEVPARGRCVTVGSQTSPMIRTVLARSNRIYGVI